MTLPLIIILGTCITSYLGFSNSAFRNDYVFNIGAIKNGQYYRLITSGFLHADIQHLLFNMFTLYFFTQQQYIDIIQPKGLLIIYFGSILFGNIITYLLNTKNNFYTALGASGGVSGVVFSFICFFPDSTINFIIPAWIYGIGYLGYTYWAMKKANDNIGHSAHFGGALFGIIITLLFHYEIISELWRSLFLS